MIQSEARRNVVAGACHYGPDAEDLIQGVLAATPNVVERVGARLPAGFLAAVADRILAGLVRSAKALDAMPSL